MPATPAISMVLAVIVACACAHEASAQSAAQPRQPGASRPLSANAPAAARKKPPPPHGRTQDEKSWMDRASAPATGGAGGGM